MSGRDASWERQWVNPIMVKCARSRLRWQHMASWGVVLFTLTTFFAAGTYIPMVERDIMTPEYAARSVLLPVIVIQAVVLMLFGTGAVASGMARERLQELVDYHRMTPMSPGRKLVGFLFGLPAREYFLFALTLPFIVFAVVIGDFPIGTLTHFYVVFFSSVLVYHLVGLVAGMVVPKPYFALVLSQGLVLALYFILPNLSHLGITFFEFLTIRPTFLGLVAQEVEAIGPGGAAIMADERFAAIDRFRDVPVFDVLIHPTVYTFAVQVFLIVLLSTVLIRKWKNEQSHLFSKWQSAAAFAGLGVFVIGSVWAMLSRDDMLPEAVRGIMEEQEAYPGTYVFESLLGITIVLMGVFAAAFTGSITSTKLTFERGIRRSLKLGKKALYPDCDAASGLPATLGMLAVVFVCVCLMVYVAMRKGGVFEAPPSLVAWMPLIATVGGAVLFAQGLRERFGMRAALVGLFVVWCVPFFVGIIMISVEKYTVGTYVCLPCPAMALLVGIQDVVSKAVFEAGMQPEDIIFMDEIEGDIGKMMVFSAIFHGGLALTVHIENWRHRRQIAVREQAAWAAQGERAHAA